MGGLFGGGKKKPKPVEATQPTAKPVEQMGAEDRSGSRRARRGGRALLSDTRLNPEQGVSTLGSQGL
jgi:hypothetical protein